jgi:hypothetical protein
MGPRIRIAFVLMCAMLASTAAFAMQRACTQMWCVEGYTLQFNAAQWPQGQYAFKIIADDKVYQCEGALPFNGCDAPAVTCSAAGVQIGESGCAMPAKTHGFSGLYLSDIPDNIAVTVSGPAGSFMYEGAVQKQCSFPNGEACDPRACCSAMHSVDVRWD